MLFPILCYVGWQHHNKSFGLILFMNDIAHLNDSNSQKNEIKVAD